MKRVAVYLLIGIIFCSSAFCEVDLANGLIAAWSFDETAPWEIAHDCTGNYDAIVQRWNLSYFYITDAWDPCDGRFGGSLNGSDTYNSLQTYLYAEADMQGLQAFLESGFSISSWFKLEAGFTGQSVMYNAIGWGNRALWQEFASDGNVLNTVASNPDSQVPWNWNTQGVADGQWHNLIMVWDGSTIEWFLDGSSLGTVAHGYTWPISYMQMAGLPQIAYGSGFDGKVDEIGMWSRPLNADEVAYLQNNVIDPTWQVPPYEGPYRPEPPVCSGQYPAEPNLVAWYHFEEGPGATTTDDLTADFPAADGTMENDAEVIYDSDAMVYQPGLINGNVLLSSDPNSFENAGGNTDGTWVNFGTDDKFTYKGLDRGFSISAWIYPNDLHDDTGTDPEKKNWGYIVNKGNPNSRPDLGWPEPGGASGSYTVRMYQGRVEFLLNFEDGNENSNGWFGAYGVQIGQWNHIVAVYDPNHPSGYDPDNPATYGPVRSGLDEVRLYINGEPMEMTTPSGVTWTGRLRHDYEDAYLYPLHISDAYRPFRGRIDDVRIYDAALQDEQVACLLYRSCVSRLIETDLANDDCAITMDDLNAMAANWLSPYDFSDFAAVALDWLATDLFFPLY